MYPIEVAGQLFEIKWHDFGSFKRLQVYKEGKLVGNKDFPLLADQGDGVIEYTIKRLLLGGNNGLAQTRNRIAL